jgi:hypothetical protein
MEKKKGAQNEVGEKTNRKRKLTGKDNLSHTQKNRNHHRKSMKCFCVLSCVLQCSKSCCVHNMKKERQQKKKLFIVVSMPPTISPIAVC